jgi:WD40 repeat protein
MQPMTVFRGHKGKIWFAVYSPDGKSVATGADDKTVRLWNPATMQSSILRNHTDAVLCAAYSPDGKLLATGSRDKTIKLWDPAAGKELRTLTGHTAEVRFLAFAGDGKTLVSAGGDNSVKVWDAASGQGRAAFPGQVAALSPDGKLLTTASQGSAKGASMQVRLFDLATRKQLRTLEVNARDMSCLVFSADGKLLAGVGGTDSTVRVWDTSTWMAQRGPTKLSSGVESVAFAADGKTLFTGHADGLVRLWDASSWRERTNLPAHREPIFSLAVSKDGTGLATSSRDGTVKLWNISRVRTAVALKK